MAATETRPRPPPPRHPLPPLPSARPEVGAAVVDEVPDSFSLHGSAPAAASNESWVLRADSDMISIMDDLGILASEVPVDAPTTVHETICRGQRGSPFGGHSGHVLSAATSLSLSTILDEVDRDSDGTHATAACALPTPPAPSMKPAAPSRATKRPRTRRESSAPVPLSVSSDCGMAVNVQAIGGSFAEEGSHLKEDEHRQDAAEAEYTAGWLRSTYPRWYEAKFGDSGLSPEAAHSAAIMTLMRAGKQAVARARQTIKRIQSHFEVHPVTYTPPFFPLSQQAFALFVLHEQRPPHPADGARYPDMGRVRAVEGQPRRRTVEGYLRHHRQAGRHPASV